MAFSLTPIPILFLVLLSSRPATAIQGPYNYIERKVGGRTPVQDVGTNHEVQDLGRFSVSEYNRMRRGNGGSSRHPDLAFSRVMEAERQVVAGLKYYLKIEATTSPGGTREVIESVVVVRPWDRSKVMLDFGPSSSSTDMIQGY